MICDWNRKTKYIKKYIAFALGSQEFKYIYTLSRWCMQTNIMPVSRWALASSDTSSTSLFMSTTDRLSVLSFH